MRGSWIDSSLIHVRGDATLVGLRTRWPRGICLDASINRQQSWLETVASLIDVAKNVRIVGPPVLTFIAGYRYQMTFAGMDLGPTDGEIVSVKAATPAVYLEPVRVHGTLNPKPQQRNLPLALAAGGETLKVPMATRTAFRSYARIPENPCTFDEPQLHTPSDI
jgi:hypothetical protein